MLDDLHTPCNFDAHYYIAVTSAAHDKGLELLSVEPPFARPHEWLQRRVRRAYI
jgi:hypothetical protein